MQEKCRRQGQALRQRAGACGAAEAPGVRESLEWILSSLRLLRHSVISNGSGVVRCISMRSWEDERLE